MALRALVVFVLCLVQTVYVAGQQDSPEAKKGDRRKGEDGIFESREQYGEFFKKLREFDDPELNKLMGPINDVILSSHGLKKQQVSPFTSQQSWMLRMLDNKKVRDEIELADYQYEKIKDSSNEVQKLMAERIKSVVRKQASGEVDPELFKKQINRIREESEEKFDSVVLPHQQKRLGQVLLHARLIREPFIRVLTTGDIAKEINIRPEQKKELEKEWKEIDRKYKAEIAKLKAKAHKELVTKLDQDQRAKYRELFGDDFDFTPEAKEKKDRKANDTKERRR